MWVAVKNSFCAHSCIVQLWFTKLQALNCTPQLPSVWAFPILQWAKAKMDAESWRQCAWHGVASRLGATRVTVHTKSPSRGTMTWLMLGCGFSQRGQPARSRDPLSLTTNHHTLLSGCCYVAGLWLAWSHAGTWCGWIKLVVSCVQMSHCGWCRWLGTGLLW